MFVCIFLFTNKGRDTGGSQYTCKRELAQEFPFCFDLSNFQNRKYKVDKESESKVSVKTITPEVMLMTQ